MIEFIAVSIPLTLFDQQKLEFLVRKIPEALVKVEEKKGEKKNITSFLKKLIRSLGFGVRLIITSILLYHHSLHVSLKLSNP